MMSAAEMPDIDISLPHWVILRDILRRHLPGHEVWAFGSRARHKAKPYSDLDLAVIADAPLAVPVLSALREDFSNTDLPWKVDVLEWATTSEAFRQIIAADKVVVQKAGVDG